MKNLKILLALALALGMVMSLCACGAKTPEATTQATEATTEAAPEVTTQATEATTQAPEATTEAAAEDGEEQEATSGNPVYSVTVVDQNGNPVVGAYVQFCLEACYPAATDANGQASMELEGEGYKVSFLKLPEGYTDEGAGEYYFDAGSYEMTLTLQAG